MGTWSTAVFGNDLAVDVDREYRERLAAGDSPAMAVKQLRRSFAEPLREADDRRVVWIALAAAQLASGAVTDDVRSQAMRAIAWCESPRRDEDDFPFAREALAELRAALGGPPPAPAKSPKAIVAVGAPGDVLALALPHDGVEAVIYVVGPAARPHPEYCRVVGLLELAPEAVSPASVLAALEAWRHYREVWPNGLGRGIACYDAKGKLPVRRTRVLLRGIVAPPSFTNRMQGPGAIEKAADLPWVVEHDRSSWTTRQWAVDPADA